MHWWYIIWRVQNDKFDHSPQQCQESKCQGVGWEIKNTLNTLYKWIIIRTIPMANGI